MLPAITLTIRNDKECYDMFDFNTQMNLHLL